MLGSGESTWMESIDQLICRDRVIHSDLVLLNQDSGNSDGTARSLNFPAAALSNCPHSVKGYPHWLISNSKSQFAHKGGNRCA